MGSIYKSAVFACLLFLAGCMEKDVFSPGKKYLYSPVWKIWEIRYVDKNSNSSKNRDTDTWMIFTDSVVFLSNNDGVSFLHYKPGHISMDSISFSLNTPTTKDVRSYKVVDMYVTPDAFPPADSIRMKRDQLFPEIKGKLLFLQLENKKPVRIENQNKTEYLLLYN